MKTSICSGWEFTPQWSEEFAAFEIPGEPVELPHNPVEQPLHYADSESYQMICGYRRTLELTPTGKRYFLRFDGAGHVATVFVNGKEAGSHACGYTAFTLDITDYVQTGENRIAVRLDTTEKTNVPPFGYVVDYLTYGGLYREAWLIEKSVSHIRDIRVSTPSLDSVEVSVDADTFAGEYFVEILDSLGSSVWSIRSRKANVDARGLVAKPWHPDHPNLYTCRVTLQDGDRIEDVEEVTFGFRTAEFKADGFYLNGERYFLRGLNRHQCYPYVGYAATESLQREDARILKQELSCNAVRTSHYPQSQYFIDECDRQGLLVFTELPGWQHIGDKEWKQQACRNVEEMVTQYRNHPSIILWGVRINESADDDSFYRETNKLARKLDPTRATSGVRYLEKSKLLEDVYAYNDFSHTGHNPGVKPKKKVTTNRKKAFLISEHNGHMFPTKSFDTWQRRQSHALRHMQVLNDAYRSGEHAGCFGWCMFDYPTHKDFGAGDRICYHGVMDFFRNPKIAATAYAAQGDAGWVLDAASTMDIGDYPGGEIGEVAVFSNAEEVALYKNDMFVRKLHRSQHTALPHPPFVMDDLIGCLLETQEGYAPKKAAALKDCLLALKKYGMAGLPFSYKLKFGWCMVRYGMRFQDGVRLFGKYVGNWGGEATRWRLDALVGGETVASVTKGPSTALHLEVIPGAQVLRRKDTYDMTSLRIRIRDEWGNPVPYAQLPVTVQVEGAAKRIGPEVVTAEGGMCGTYLRTTSAPGPITVTVTAPGMEAVTVELLAE